MLTAFIFIAIILVSNGARAYFKHKFDVSENLEDITRALRKNQKACELLREIRKTA